MDILRIKIFIARVKLYIFKKMTFLPQRIRNKIAERLFNNIKIITYEMKYKKII